MDKSANRRSSVRLRGKSHSKTYKSDEDDEIKEIPTKRRLIFKRRDKSSDRVNKRVDVNHSNPISVFDDELKNDRAQNKGVNEDGFVEDEVLNDTVQVPTSLLLSFNPKDPKQKQKDDQRATEERVFQILESVPTRQEIQDNPSLQKPARRKPYNRLNPQVPKSSNLLFTRKKVRQPSPKLELEELSKHEYPEEAELKPGINLISVPISQTDKKYNRIEPVDEEWPAEVEIVWPNSVDQLINPCLVPQHQCPMVDYLREKIHDSKLHTKKAWETVKETVQQAREKEHLIRQLKMQLYDERHAGGLSESLVRALKESRYMSSYAKMTSAARNNAAYVFQLILEQAFPNFNQQDLNRIFDESMHLSGHNVNQAKYGYIKSDISSNIATLEGRMDNWNESSLSGLSSNHANNRTVNNVTPLTFLDPKRTNFSNRSHVNSELDNLADIQMRERNILKTHPTKQFVPPERARSINKKTTNKVLPLSILPPAPTLVRRFPTTAQMTRMPTRVDTNPRHSALGFAIQQCTPQQHTSASFDPKPIPIKPRGIEVLRTFVTRRSIPMSRTWKSADLLHRLPTSNEMLSRMADDTESNTQILQEANKRRLEALNPIKTEPAEYD